MALLLPVPPRISAVGGGGGGGGGGGVGVAWRQQEACAHAMKSARSELKVVGKTEEVCFPCRSHPSRRG